MNNKEWLELTIVPVDNLVRNDYILIDKDNKKSRFHRTYTHMDINNGKSHTVY